MVKRKKALSTVHITVLNEDLDSALAEFTEPNAVVMVLDRIFPDIITFAISNFTYKRPITLRLRLLGIPADVELFVSTQTYSRHEHVRFTAEGEYYYPPHADVAHLHAQDRINAMKYKLNTAIYSELSRN